MIPKVFHFVFGLKPQTEPFHLMYYLCLASCLEVNRPDAVLLHYHREPYGPWWERIKPRLHLRKVPLNAWVEGFDYPDPRVARYRYAHAADFVRLEALLEHGGIYADIDSLFLRPLPERIFRHACVLGRERPAAPDTPSLCNAWIGAAAGNAFIRRWLAGMREAFDGSWSAHSTVLPYRLAQAHPDLVHVEPETSFYAFDWTPQRIDDLFLRDRPVPEDAYSLHLWAHLWQERERRDFSRFHAGRLTPAYVAHARTTYARLARPFLPVGEAPGPEGYRRERLRAGIDEAAAALAGLTRRLRRS